MSALEKVSVIQQTDNLPSVVTPMSMLAKAVEGGADIDVLEKLMGLSERWEANQARKAFDEAVSAAKAEIPPIVRNATGHNAKKYADFAAIARSVDPVLGKHGLSYRFRTTQTDRINVTCVLSHKAGHSEETTLSGPPDATGSKNAIQAIGSTLKYLQRYSLVQMLGLADSLDDDDGAASDVGAFVSPSQLSELNEIADEVKADKAKFCKYFKIGSFAELPGRSFANAKQLLEAKRVAK